jgi:hypothetical protein
LSMLLISSWRCDSASLCWQRRAFCCSFNLLRYCNYRQERELTGFRTILHLQAAVTAHMISALSY